MVEKIAAAITFVAKNILNIPVVRTWLQKHPRVHQQLTERLTTRHFSGLPLTILAAVLLYSISLLIGVTEDYFLHSQLVAVDIRLANLLYVFRSGALLRVFYFITLFAETGVIITLTVIGSVFLWAHRQRVYVFSLWLTLIVGEGLTYVGKHIVQRERPDIFLRAITEDSFSFPSGHATTVVLFYGFIAYLIIRRHVSLAKQILILALLAIFVVLVDVSRLYLGVHYLSDVIAGNLVGFTALIFSIGVTEWYIARKPHLAPQKTRPSLIFSVLIIATVLVSAIYLSATPPTSKNKPVTVQPISTEKVLSLFTDKKLPRFTETVTSTTQEPLNILIIAPESCFVQDITGAGWVLADGVSLHSTERLAKTALLNQSYPTAPMTPSFYNAEPHEYGFEKETDRSSVRARHHARFWKTEYETPLGFLYVGTVSLDTGIKWGITHTIAPDIDTERDLFVADLKQKGVLGEESLVPFVSPYIGSNFSGDLFFTNGKTALLVFSPCAIQ